MKTLVAIASLVAVSVWPCPIALADAVQLPIATANAEPGAPRPSNGYWSEGEPRPFVSAKIELGIPYAKPGFSFGYGMPHWLWAGVDVNAISTLEFVQTYAGVRAASPFLDLAFGARDTWSYGKAFVTMPPFTARRRLELADGQSALLGLGRRGRRVCAAAPLGLGRRLHPRAHARRTAGKVRLRRVLPRRS